MPVPAITLTKMNTSEYASWRENDEAAYAAEKAEALNISLEQATELSRQTYQRLLPQDSDTTNNYLFTIRDAAGTHVGDLWYTISTEWNVTCLFIASIEIKPAFQRQGFGRAAMAILEVEAAGHKANRIALHVVSANKSAIALYEKAGYHTTDMSMAKDLK